MRSATRNKTGKDAEYLAWIRALPCAVCAEPEWRGHRIEAAHVGDRGLSQKCPDREAIPLCPRCHRFDKDSHHRAGKRFWVIHGLDREALIGALNEQYETKRQES